MRPLSSRLTPRAPWLALAFACACVAAPPAAHAGWMDSLFGSSGNSSASAESSSDEPTRKVWPLGEFSFVRLQPAKNDVADAAPNRHPAKVSEALVEKLLSSVRMPKGKNATEPLFSSAEAWTLAPAISEALEAASPGEDVLVQSSARRAVNSIEAPTVATARIFVTAEGLQLLVHATRFDYYDRWRGAAKVPDFPVASRKATGTTVLQSPLAKSQAASWLVFPLSADLQAAALAPPPPKAMAPVAAPLPAKPRDAAFFNEQAQRLDGLKNLREKNLITEAEYQQKRGEVLQGL
jgi:hypothetical protein